MEEELRLTYVAMTRARDFLYVLWPLRYYHRSRGLSDNHSYAQCCRFFTKAVTVTMDRVAVGHGDHHGDAPPENVPPGRISERIRQMWQ